MDVTKTLDDCLAAVSGCQLVAFIDLDSKMVLAASSNTRQRQERLDTLGTLASRLLPMPGDDLTRCLSQGGTSAPQVAIQLSTAETLTFIRSETEPSEALCCSGSPNASVDAMIRAARTVLPNIGVSE